MALQQTRATPAAEIKGDQAELNSKTSSLQLCPKKPEPHCRTEQWEINSLEKKFFSKLIP